MLRRIATVPILLATLALAGCAGEQDPLKEGRLEIDYWETWTGFEYQAMKDVVDKFNRSQDEIYVNMLSVSDLERKVLIATAGNDPPDVSGLNAVFIPQYADKNALEPLEPFMPILDVKREDYFEALWLQGWYDGRLYGLPSTPATTALHWNKDAFRAAGLDPEQPPRTLEELDAFAEKLTRKRDARHYETLGFVQTQPGWWPWYWVYLFGGRWWDGEGTITANCPENVRAFEWIQSYAQKYGTSVVRNFTDGLGNFASSEDGFFSGKIAMVVQGVWLANFIDEYSDGMDWGAAPFPSPGGRLPGVTVVESNVLVIPRNARHKEAAAKFIGFTQRPENLQYLALGHTKFMPLKLAEQLDYSEHPNKEIEVFVGLCSSPNTHSAPRLPIWPEYSQEIANAVEEVWLERMTPQEALDRVQERIEAKWDQYQHIKRAVERAREKRS